MVVAVLNFLTTTATVATFFGSLKTVSFIIGPVFLFLGYQVLILCNLNRKLERQQNNSTAFKAFHSIIEITFTSVTTFYLVTELRMGSFIDSQLMVMYFFLIVLSVMHLDEKICVLAGVITSLEYAVLIYYEFHVMDRPEYFSPAFESAQYFKAVMLALCGIVAAFVSMDLKKKIQAANEYQTAKNELELLRQQVSKEISKTLMEDKSITKRHEGTVMFVDIRNFTAFADTHSADEVIEYQNKFVAPSIDIISHHQGVVFQILGDGLMACFESPVKNVLHADMAFQSSIEILKHIRKASDSGLIPSTQIGIGLYCGIMVAGNIGNDQRKQFSIRGTPVIVASRIEQLNKKYGTQLLISEDVLNRIERGKVDIAFMAKEPIKGIEKYVAVYKVA